MAAGVAASVKGLFERWQWEENNVLVGIMLDWDDVQAVAARAVEADLDLATLLRRYQAGGANYLSIPEITIGRLLAKGEVMTDQGSDPDRVYLRARTNDLANLIVTELQARLPQVKPASTKAKKPLVSFKGDLPTIAEVGLGFNPAHVELARQAELGFVPRPVGFSWMQPEMIARTLNQAVELGAKLVAIQGTLVPGHEFNMSTTIATLKAHSLKCAYFSESRHQRGDWHLVKHLTRDGLVVLAHEFQPEELLEEDWHTVSDRWARLATEAGIRLCSVRFFRAIHAGDPLESVDYIQTLAQALRRAGFVGGQVGAVNLTAFHPHQDPLILAGAGLGAAGAIGLAADLLPLPDQVKVMGAGAAALALTGLPFLEQTRGHNAGHHHNHDHDHHHHDHDHDHHHDHHHHHDHNHDHGHSHGPDPATAYASKGIGLAAAIAYPAAAMAAVGQNPLTAAAQAVIVGAAGAATLGAAVADIDYTLNVEPYRSYNLDWLLPLGLAAALPLLKKTEPPQSHGLWSRLAHHASRITHHSHPQNPKWPWLPLAGLVLFALKLFAEGNQDPLARLDREHRHSHTHHLSAFQRLLGDSKMALAPKPLRKWSLLAPLGTVCAVIFARRGRQEAAALALTVAAAGQVASLNGFRNAQRPFLKTVEGRAQAWGVGLALAGVIWLIAWLVGRSE